MYRIENMVFYSYVVSLFIYWNLVCHATSDHHGACHYSNGYLDCSYKHMLSIDCRFPGNITNIDFSFNEIKRVPSRCFEGLANLTIIALNDNKLKHIDTDAFDGLQTLQRLRLYENDIEDIPANVFRVLTKLQYLEFHFNQYSRNVLSFQRVMRGVSSLPKLKMLMIDINSQLNLTDWCPESQQLHNLTLRGFPAEMYVTMALFRCSPYLTNLALARVNGIHESSFDRLFYLEFLTVGLSDNTNITSIFQSFGAFHGQNMTVISVWGNNYLNGFTLNRNHFRHIQHICLKQLLLKQMFINKIEPRSFRIFAHKSKCLEVLDLSENSILIAGSTWMLSLPLFSQLKILKVSHFKKSDELNNNIYHVNGGSTVHLNTVTIPLPITLEELHITNTYSRYDLPNLLIVRNGNRLEVLDLAYAGFTACNGTIQGLPNLQFLDMSGWNCSIFSEELLSNFPKLQTLIARESFLGKGFRLNRKNFKLFKRNKALRHIDLSMNNIYTIPSGLFDSHFSHLEFLNLSNNKLHDFTAISTKMTQLKVIDLSSNNFANIPAGMRNVLEKINPNKIYFGGNTFQCSCKSIKFLMWLKKTKLFKTIDIKNITCITEKDFTSPIIAVLQDINNFSERCESKVVITIITILCSIVVAAILIIVYIKYKHFFEYIYIRIKIKPKKYKNLEENRYEFDAFVSHSHLDKKWVLELNNILSKRGVNFCLADRDFDLGEDIAENVVKSIDRSRKVIFVITENFLNSSWGSYELEMTRMHAIRNDRDNMIIVILKDDIPLPEMPKVLRQIWYKIVCIQWNDQTTNGIEAEELFYSRLHEAVLH